MYMPQVFNSYTQPKPLGVGGGLWGLDVEWYYHWSVSPYENDPRFVPMVWCPTPLLLAIERPLIVARVQQHPGDTWLIGNEPDGNLAQCGGRLLASGKTVRNAPREYALSVIEVSDLIKQHDPTAQLLIGGIIQIGTAEGASWWSEFISELQAHDYVPDGYHIHAYPCWSTTCTGWGMGELFTALDTWYQEQFIGLGLSGPVWITETGAGPVCGKYKDFEQQAWIDVRDNVMLPFKEYFQDSPYATAAWFVSYWGGEGLPFWCGYLVDARSTPIQLTPLGEQWQ